MTTGKNIAAAIKNKKLSASKLIKDFDVDYSDISRLKNEAITWHIFKRRNKGAMKMLKFLGLSEDEEDLQYEKLHKKAMGNK